MHALALDLRMSTTGPPGATEDDIYKLRLALGVDEARLLTMLDELSEFAIEGPDRPRNSARLPYAVPRPESSISSRARRRSATEGSYRRRRSPLL